MKKLIKNQNGDEDLNSPHSQKIQSRYSVPRGTIGDFITLKYNRVKAQNNLSKLFFYIGLCISLLFIITAFEWKFYEKGKIVDLGENNSNFENLMDVPVTEQPVIPPPKVIQPKIIEVSDEEEIIDEIDIDLDVEMTEEQVIEERVFVENIMEIEEEKADEIFTIVEQQPMPVGGYEAFYQYVGKNLRYPSRAQRNSIEGRVYIQFVVEKDGSLTDISVLKGIGGGCDEEAMRIISNAPNWNPGKQRGKPVRVKMILPIHFQLLNL